MTTITLTRENFWKKMSLIYQKVNSVWKIRINLSQEEDNWDEYTQKNHKAWLKSKKDLKKGDVMSFDELKSKYS